jgi:hypothetical protein
MGNTYRATILDTRTLRTKESLKSAFTEVETLMPTTCVFGKGGYTNVKANIIKTAIRWFQSDACNTGQSPPLTKDQRKALVRALERLDVARAQWKTASDQR